MTAGLTLVGETTEVAPRSHDLTRAGKEPLRE